MALPAGRRHSLLGMLSPIEYEDFTQPNPWHEIPVHPRTYSALPPGDSVCRRLGESLVAAVLQRIRAGHSGPTVSLRVAGNLASAEVDRCWSQRVNYLLVARSVTTVVADYTSSGSHNHPRGNIICYSILVVGEHGSA